MGEAASTRRAGLTWLGPRWLRRRWPAMVPLALVMAAGSAGAMVAFGSARSTATAYADYLRGADVGDVVINPSVSSTDIDQVIRSLPNVEKVTSDAMFAVTSDDGHPRPRRAVDEGNGPVVYVRGSSDGRYTTMDRPVVRSGRMPTGPREIAVTADTAAIAGVAIGDVVPLAFWQPGPTGIIGPTPEAYQAFLDETITPIDVEQVTVVGLISLAEEVLPDGLYPRATAIVSPDVAARYDCVPEVPPPGLTFRELAAALLPSDCATSYRYYSLKMTHGAADVKPALDDFVRRSAPLTERLQAVTDAADYGDALPQYFLIPTETEPQLRRVERAVRPTVTALTVLGATLAAVTVALAALAVARELRRSRAAQRQWRELGLSSAAGAAVVAVPPAGAAAAGLVVALVAAGLLDAGPVGIVRVLGSVGGDGTTTVVLLVGGAIAVATAAVIALLAVRSARRPERPKRRAHAGRAGGTLASPLRSPALSSGVRAAYGPRATAPVIVAGALLAAAFVAAAVFGISLSRLVSSPRSYGWPWDVAAMTGGGYGDLDVDAAGHAFGADPAVESWTVLGFTNEPSLNGEPMTTLVSFERTSDLDLTVLDGRLPTEADEVAVGESTARSRRLHVGDAVDIGGAEVPIRARISGIVVFPSLGPLLAERLSAGTGLLIPEAMFEAAAGQDNAQSLLGLATFVGIDLTEQADTPATRARLEQTFATLDLQGAPPNIYEQPVRPPEIVDASSMRAVPLAIGIAFAATAATGALLASWASMRARRVELAVLRALGFNEAQVRRSVYAQSVATMLGALVIGVPSGLIAGRALWRAFASQLGVVPDPANAWWPLLLTVAGALVLALVAALVPGWIAARPTPAEGLQAE